MADEDVPLTLEHTKWFGLIVANFARAELIIQQTLSAIHQHDIARIMILTVGLGYSGKRDALLATLRGITIPEDHAERIRWYLGQVHKHNSLRNNIAHAYWVAGKRPGSIKPYQMKVRGGVLGLFGHHEEEPDHTLEEFGLLASELTKTLDDFAAYLKASGYVAVRPE
jgi:hypothetical protein